MFGIRIIKVFGMIKEIVVVSNGMGSQSKLLPILLYEKHPALKSFWNNTTIFNIFADTQDEEHYIYEDLIEYQKYLHENNYPKLITISRGKLSEEYYKNAIIPTRQFRHCTDKFKIREIRKYIRNYLKENNFSLKDVNIRMLIGITTDEIFRIRDSEVKWIKNEFPFVYNLNFKRKDCEEELQKRNLNYHKSGCYYCPFLSFKRFYEYVKDKPDKKRIAIDMEVKARKNNSKMMLFNKPIEVLIRNKDRQKSLTSFIDSNIDFYIKEESCDSGYCFI